ncbi:hypothetical protein DL764_005257 [Monosporascus ibericus]|uniref:Uncharacterized protein n=1 Tax=Monosporascus ibericus TaxID=155417 RepID=A0A4Q4TCF5_9PEZI|nr:hypothetical protein DL764_005257 [Monosporascus ibericus]
METINSVAAAAAKAVWGENTTQQQHGDEPASGQTGNTAKGEPYDAGNLVTVDEPENKTAGASVSGENITRQQHGDEPVSGQTGNTTKGEPYDADEPENEPTGVVALDKPENKTTGVTPDEKPLTRQNGSVEFAKSTGTAATTESTPGHPSTGLKTRDVPTDTTQGQNDVRNPEDPHTNPRSAPTDVDNTGEGLSKPQKLEGSGPKPLEAVAKEHGGDAGNTGLTPTPSTSGVSGTSTKAANETASEDDANGPRSQNKREGSGEHYVKSSGLQADGGDFDVTKPGAGREADRLMEEKGIHNPNGDSPEKGVRTESKSGEKKGLGQKIKDKLHRH